MLVVRIRIILILLLLLLVSHLLLFFRRNVELLAQPEQVQRVLSGFFSLFFSSDFRHSATVRHKRRRASVLSPYSPPLPRITSPATSSMAGNNTATHFYY